MQSIKEKIIVSVDDFGIRDVADSILPLAREGKIDRVSVLVNYVKSKEQAEALAATGVKIDLHLELIRLTGTGEKVEENALWRGMKFLVRYALGFVGAGRVEKEWIAQIERFKELFGRYPDGLNSHEHVHYFPKFFRIFLSLTERYHIPFVRFAHRGMLESDRSVVAKVLSSLWKTDASLYVGAKQPLTSSDFFVSYDWIANFDAFLEALPEGKTEIVFHPEKKDEYDVIERYF